MPLLRSHLVAEKTAFDFVKEQKPGFVLNTVLPSTTVSPPMSPTELDQDPAHTFML